MGLDQHITSNKHKNIDKQSLQTHGNRNTALCYCKITNKTWESDDVNNVAQLARSKLEFSGPFSGHKSGWDRQCLLHGVPQFLSGITLHEVEITFNVFIKSCIHHSMKIKMKLCKLFAVVYLCSRCNVPVNDVLQNSGSGAGFVFAQPEESYT